MRHRTALYKFTKVSEEPTVSNSRVDEDSKPPIPFHIFY